LAGYKPNLNSQGTLQYGSITGKKFLRLDCSYLPFKDEMKSALYKKSVRTAL